MNTRKDGINLAVRAAHTLPLYNVDRIFEDRRRHCDNKITLFLILHILIFIYSPPSNSEAV